MLTWHLRTCSLIVCRFAGYHSLLPALLGKVWRKPVLIIIGGNEGHHFPEFNYGGYIKPFYRLSISLSVRFATHLAPVEKNLILHDYRYDKVRYPKQGLKSHIPSLKTPFTIIHNGYDSIQFQNSGSSKTKNSFLTVALNIQGGNFWLKGVDMIIAMARHFTNYNFTIIADTSGMKFHNLPDNITIKPPVPNDRLPEIYSQYEFYLQLSMAEGFPNALCEAMLCECIPIGSNVFGIPMIIDKTGFILDRKDSTLLINLINEAVTSNKEVLSKLARQRIIKNFTIANRKEKLLKLTEELIDKN